MALEDTIADIVGKLREGAFPNKQSISQGIVLRVLSDLHWDVFEPSVVWPEYVTAGVGRADFALCEPRSKPKVLIEVKQPGKAEGGVKQSLQYAFHTGVPFVVLTDGQTWSFYLPAEPGDYEDRRVFKLDLFEHAKERSASVLDGYLGWQRVASGKALESARSEHRSRTRRTLARKAIPNAWTRLVAEQDDLLIELVGDAVESKEGVRPENEDVARFLAKLGDMQSNPSYTSRTVVSQIAKPMIDRTSEAKSAVGSSEGDAAKNRLKGKVSLFGEAHPYRNGKERLIIVLRELARRDGAFLDRCYRVSAFKGRKRRHISRTKEELYPGRSDMQRDFTEQLPGGWWLGTNLNNKKKEALVRAAIEVAGLKLGFDIEV